MALTQIGKGGLGSAIGIGTNSPDTLLVLSKTDSGTTVNKDITSTNGPVLTIHNPDQTDNNLSSIQFTSRGTNNANEMASAGIHVVHEDQGGTYSIGSMGLYTTSPAGSYQNNLNITSNGEVTKPLQPAFNVHPASTQSNVAINTSVTVVFGTEVFDIGGNFASNTFTAPVTGKYLLTVNLYLDQFDASADYFQTEIVTSNRNYAVVIESSSSDHDHFNNASLAVVADMDASDTAFVRVFQGSGAAQIDILADSDFTGALIC